MRMFFDVKENKKKNLFDWLFDEEIYLSPHLFVTKDIERKTRARNQFYLVSFSGVIHWFTLIQKPRGIFVIEYQTIKSSP